MAIHRYTKSESALGLLIVCAGMLVYLNSFSGAFVFDDSINIVKNEQIRQLWPVGGWLHTRRPVVTLSLALNYRLGHLDPWGYHLFNLTVHLLAGLALYGIIRRTIIQTRRLQSSDTRATGFAASVALLWLLHPLQTQSVTYIIQRSESMMGMFYLLTLYCLIRGETSRRRRSWHSVSVVCCMLGMGCKAVMATAPVMMLLYDRLFMAGSLKETFRRRWGLYLGLAASWLALLFTGVIGGVLQSASKGETTIGFGIRGIDPLSYALTQPAVILHYLRLTLWPQGHCLDYGWPIIERYREALLPGLMILIMLGGSIWAIRRKPWLGFAGAWFFIILSPTSSVIPIKDPAFDHRMYLPSAAMIVIAMAGGWSLLNGCFNRFSFGKASRRVLPAVMLLAVASALGVTTNRRNALFRDPILIWQDTIRHAPNNPRAHNALGWVYLKRGSNTLAMKKFRDAIEADPTFAPAYVNLGAVLLEEGDDPAAIRAFQQALTLHPQGFGGEAHEKLAAAHLREGDYGEAIRSYREAIAMFPGQCDETVYLNLGHALMMVNEMQAAIESFRTSLRLNPNYVLGYYNLGNAFSRMGDLTGAIRAFRRALTINPRYAEASVRLGVALDRNDRTDEAIDCFRNALTMISRQTAEWVRAEAHYQMGQSQMKLGRHSEAATSYRSALRNDPGHTGARQGLQKALQQH